MTDMLIPLRFDEFLKDKSRVVDLTDAKSRATCDRGNSCKQTYFVSGGIENLAPRLANDTNDLPADYFMAVGQQGFTFAFESPIQGFEFDTSQHCRTYPLSVTAWALCLANISDDVLVASKSRSSFFER